MSQVLVNGIEWFDSDTSDFEPDPEGSSALSFDDDSAASDDLNLYEPTCVC